MVSKAATSFWAAIRAAPKQIDLPLTKRREAGEHAEDATAEPSGLTYLPAPDVGGLWAIPAEARRGAAILYLFGGGYVLGFARLTSQDGRTPRAGGKGCGSGA